jgi:hypothetical protein
VPVGGVAATLSSRRVCAVTFDGAHRGSPPRFGPDPEADLATRLSPARAVTYSLARDRDWPILPMVRADTLVIALQALKPRGHVLPAPFCVAQLNPTVKVGGATPECTRGIDGGSTASHFAPSVGRASCVHGLESR